MRPVDIATIVAYASGLLAVLAAVRTHVARRRLHETTHQLTVRLNQAAEDRAFAGWATWTMLSVTDQQGYVHAATLRQLYTTGQWDHVWDAPVAVAIWHGNPDVVQRFNEELDEEEKRA